MRATLIHDNIHWQSDWNGYEVGFDEIDVVGLYSKEIQVADDYGDPSNTVALYMYINAENGHVLESWIELPEE